MSLPQANKISLKKNKDLFLTGKKFYGSFFTIVFIPSKTPTYAILVTKKIAKFAVNRNKIRRRTTYLLRKNSELMALGSYLVLPKNTVLKALFNEISSDFATLLDRIKTT